LLVRTEKNNFKLKAKTTFRNSRGIASNISYKSVKQVGVSNISQAAPKL
jgi:hypothetical protein